MAQALKRMSRLVKEDKTMMNNIEASINCTNVKT